MHTVRTRPSLLMLIVVAAARCTAVPSPVASAPPPQASVRPPPAAHAPRHAAARTPLRAPTPLSPADGQAIVARGGAASVRLAWKGRTGEGARYFVDVQAQDQTKAVVLSTYVDRPEATVRLPGRAAQYRWRPYLVDLGRHSYSAGPWSAFSIEAEPAASGPLSAAGDPASPASGP